MAYNYSDRISSLKEQTDEQKQGRIRFSTAFVRTFFPLLAIGFLFSHLYLSSIASRAGDHELDWEERINQQFEDRLEWLRMTPFFLSPGGAGIYEQFGKAVVSTLRPNRDRKAEAGDILDFSTALTAVSRYFTSLVLRAGFVIVAFWPLWTIGAGLGLVALRKRFRGKRTDDILGICDRGHGPFYSGIYGPLRSNNSVSATEFTCPNLACPDMVKPQVASSHKLAGILKQYGALNQTNLDLTRIILAYADYPSYVEGEQSSEEEVEAVEGAEQKPVALSSSIISNAGGTISTSSIHGLEAALSAHQVLIKYVAQARAAQLSNSQLNSSHAAHATVLAQVGAQLPPAAKVLVESLTPNRAWALGHIPAAMIASAYLATEAGKCLVYQRDGNGFTRISRYPHLQARAILQSLVSYGREYNGDSRLIIRQAIICCRRHGDFGRAFLPDKMAVESRALRDWLEVLYAEPKKRDTVANLVELDAHIEELNVNWRTVYVRRMRQGLDVHQAPASKTVKADGAAQYWKGLVHKSVVLVPLQEVVTMALRGVDESRVKRITELLNITRRYQTSLSISARLPGFKRQAVEAQHAVLGDTLLDRWVIVRRMLTRYNWLSTRVGDDAVPADGYVHGVVFNQTTDTQVAEIVGLDMLVPIRQRRYDEMFGKQWEGLYFVDTPHPANVRVFVQKEEFQETLRREKESLKRHGAQGGKLSVASG